MDLWVTRRGALSRWCERWLSAEPTEVIFATGHLSEVIGLRLADGREVVLKVRPNTRRIGGCVEVQRHLWQSGYPCPMPLAGPAAFEGRTATAEEYVAGGELLERDTESPSRFAGLLWQLVDRCAHMAVADRLSPPPPWVAWDHNRAGVWPLGDDGVRDLNAHPEPRWLDEIGERTRAILNAFAAPHVIGHVDWESQNIRWEDGRPLVVHDWDSAASRPEATVAGAASAVFTRTDSQSSSSIDEIEFFLDAYQRARGRAFTPDELRVAWAAGLWVRAFDAKDDSVMRSGDPAGFADEAWARLRRAAS
jgi:Ser/Thr protein kinase RdoA (MazF antagonist)